MHAWSGVTERRRTENKLFITQASVPAYLPVKCGIEDLDLAGSNPFKSRQYDAHVEPLTEWMYTWN